MSELERIRRDVRTELASGEELAPEPEADFDRILEAALADLDPTDEWIEAVDKLVEARELTASTREAAPTNALRIAQGAHPLDLAVLRRGAGLSVSEAATRLGISGRAIEQIESARPLGWVQVEASAVASYLDALGVRRADFLRWLASLLTSRPGRYAYGYRPGERPIEPVVSAQDSALSDEFRTWASAVLGPG